MVVLFPENAIGLKEVVVYVDEEEGMSSAGTVALVLGILILVVSIMCLVFCRCVKKETDDHFKRLKTRAIHEKL